MVVVAFGRLTVSTRPAASQDGASDAVGAGRAGTARVLVQSSAPAKSTSVTEPARGLASASGSIGDRLGVGQGSAVPTVLVAAARQIAQRRAARQPSGR